MLMQQPFPLLLPSLSELFFELFVIVFYLYLMLSFTTRTHSLKISNFGKNPSWGGFSAKLLVQLRKDDQNWENDLNIRLVVTEVGGSHSGRNV